MNNGGNALSDFNSITKDYEMNL